MRLRMLIVLVIAVALSSCADESQPVLTGTLEVSFVNSDELTLGSKIFEINNLNYPLFEDLKADANGKLIVKNINFGNYIIEYFVHDDLNGGNFGRKKSFQINANRTTKISISL